MKIFTMLPVRLDGEDHEPGVALDVDAKAAEGLIAAGAAQAIKAAKPVKPTKPGKANESADAGGK